MLVRKVNIPHRKQNVLTTAICVAEDMSGMPGMCLPIKDGSIGFHYRLAMGFADMWIRTVKENHEERWDIRIMWEKSHQYQICLCISNV